MHVTLEIRQTSRTCIRYMLRDLKGKRIWSNRVVPTEAGHQGARARMSSWALQRGYRVVLPAEAATVPAMANR